MEPSCQGLNKWQALMWSHSSHLFIPPHFRLQERELKRQKLKDAHADAYIAQNAEVVRQGEDEQPVIPKV